MRSIRSPTPSTSASRWRARQPASIAPAGRGISVRCPACASSGTSSASAATGARETARRGAARIEVEAEVGVDRQFCRRQRQRCQQLSAVPLRAAVRSDSRLRGRSDCPSVTRLAAAGPKSDAHDRRNGAAEIGAEHQHDHQSRRQDAGRGERKNQHRPQQGSTTR